MTKIALETAADDDARGRGLSSVGWNPRAMFVDVAEEWPRGFHRVGRMPS
jgi:hypothetical protein